MTVETPARPRTWPKLALWGGAFVVIAVLMLLIALSGERSGAPLDPENPGPDGGRAVSRLLEGQGVKVQVVRGMAELDAVQPGPGDTLVIGYSEQLSVHALDQAMEKASDAARIVVLAPGTAPAHRLALQARAEKNGAGSVSAGCSVPETRENLRISTGGYRYTPGSARTTVCFADESGAAYLVRLDAFPGRPEVWVVGAGDALSNRHLAEEGNAALVLRVLGHSPRTLWYQALPQDTPPGASGEKSLQDVVPSWVGYAIALLFFTVLAVMMWRGRRFGRLVREPLPVLVRTGELTEARGRMYRAARDLPRASRALQIGTRRRLAQRFGLAATAAPDRLVPHVVAATGLAIEDLTATLYTYIPPTDAELQRLAARLATIEEEVRGR